ncbi:SAM-dependent methyltransferase, partial [Bacillus paralicheniformis]|nr:SAM-dependent methyltransferase [Bacillus paralicheniformis]
LELAGIQLQADLIEGEVQQLECGFQYDAATCMLVLHFVRHKLEFLQQIASRLADGAPFFMAAIQGDMTSETFKWQMCACGISEQGWESFSASIGSRSHPVPASEVEDLLGKAGFTNVTRFFSAYVIDGWFAVKGGGKQ